MQTTISILTPLYNSEKTLELFLVALQNQELPKNTTVEFLLCDDGSTDASTDILHKHLPTLKALYTIRLFEHTENKGWRESLSFLYEQSHGDIIVFVDSDAIPSNNQWLTQLTSPIITTEQSVVQGDFWSQLYTNSFWAKQHEKWRKSIYLSRYQNTDNTLNSINTRNLAIARPVIEQVKTTIGYFLDPKATLAGADTKLGFAIRDAGYPIYLNEHAKIKHADPIMLSKIIKQKIKHGYLDGVLGIHYANNLYTSVFLPFKRSKVSPFFSLPITISFIIANTLGYIVYIKRKVTTRPRA